jgi:hypothetical protein
MVPPAIGATIRKGSGITTPDKTKEESLKVACAEAREKFKLGKIGWLDRREKKLGLANSFQ